MLDNLVFIKTNWSHNTKINKPECIYSLILNSWKKFLLKHWLDNKFRQFLVFKMNDLEISHLSRLWCAAKVCSYTIKNFKYMDMRKVDWGPNYVRWCAEMLNVQVITLYSTKIARNREVVPIFLLRDKSFPIKSPSLLRPSSWFVLLKSI